MNLFKKSLFGHKIEKKQTEKNYSVFFDRVQYFFFMSPMYLP